MYRHVWRYDASSCNSVPPLADFSRSVICTLRLIQDLKRLPYHIQDLRDLESEANYSVAQVLHSRRYNESDVSFISSSQWVDNFLHLVYFLHHEGVKIVQKWRERIPAVLQKLKAKFLMTMKPCLETCSLCSIEPNEQPPVAVNNNLPLQAVEFS